MASGSEHLTPARADLDAFVPGDWPHRARKLLVAALELTTPHDLESVLQTIVESAASIVDARYAAIGVYEGGALTTFVHYGLDEATTAAIGDDPRGRGVLGEVVRADRPLRIDDLEAHPSTCGFPPAHPSMTSFLGVSIRRSGRRYGGLYVTEKRGETTFDETDEALLTALAAFAAGAIETTRLVDSELSRARAQEQARARRELFAQVIAAQEAERARVSRDLHDDVGQALTSVLLGLRLVEDSIGDGPPAAHDAPQRVAELRDLVADALRRTRQLAFDLRPTVLDDVGLVAALQRLSNDLASRSGLTVELDISAIQVDERLPPSIETVVYRVVQEALTNIVRHAGASTASVTVTDRNGRVRVFVEDDGNGFDLETRAHGHLGIDGMVERAELVGGSLSVTSSSGQGTVVLLEVPRG